MSIVSIALSLPDKSVPLYTVLILSPEASFNAELIAVATNEVLISGSTCTVKFELVKGELVWLEVIFNVPV